MSDMIGRHTNISSHANLIRLLSKLCIIPKTPYTDTKITHYIVYPKEFFCNYMKLTNENFLPISSA